MSLCDPVLPGFDEPTVCRVDFVMATRVRDDGGIWKPLETLRRPPAKFGVHQNDVTAKVGDTTFAAPRFSRGPAKGADRSA